MTNLWVKNSRPLLEPTKGLSRSNKVHFLPEVQPIQRYVYLQFWYNSVVPSTGNSSNDKSNLSQNAVSFNGILVTEVVDVYSFPLSN